VSYAENRGRNTGAGNFVVEYTDSGRTLSAPRVVLRVEHGPADPTSAGLHLGSDIGFGPDGYLHVTLGDAGGPLGGPNVAQDFTQLAGSVLRLDPLDDAYPGDPDRNYAPAPGNPAMGPGSDPAIWAGGLRNPYRANFDPVTGAYYIGDVGQEDREEINLGHAGANYGWNFREGTAPGPNSNPGPGSYTDPIYDYAHGAGPFEGIGVVGGLVYRGPLAGLRGQYLFGDLDDWYGDQVVDAIWSFDADAPACRPTACAAGASTAAPTR
jgi:glucose/arabinose dehydrogenase